MRIAAFVSALLLSTSTFASTIETLKGTWELVGARCLDTRVANASSREIAFIPVPEAMRMRFTDERMVVDAKFFGCVFRLTSPFSYENGEVRYSTSSMTNLCTGLRLPLEPESLRVQVESDRLKMRGLFASIGVCPLGRAPEYYFERIIP